VLPGSLAFRPDGSLFVNNYDFWSRYDPETCAATALPRPRTSWVVFSPDWRRAVCVPERNSLCTYVFDARGQPRAESTVASAGRCFTRAAFAPDGNTFAVAGFCEEPQAGPELTIRATKTAKTVGTYTGALLHTEQLVFARAGAHLVARAGASLACWTLAEPDRAPQTAENPSRKHFVSMTVHPSGLLLTVDDAWLVRVWTVPELSSFRTIAWDIGKLYTVVVSPDGARAAVGSHTGKVLVWDWD
jgi:WD40 repeat protein